MNSTYQQELIGILGNVPEYFNSTILTKEYFDKPLDYMFDKMLDSYKRNKTINFIEIMEDEKIADDLFISCISNVIQKNEKYFRSLELQAIEKYKQKMIHEYNTKLLAGDIDVNVFMTKIDNLKKINVVESHKLTGNSIRNFTKQKNRMVEFNDFKLIGLISKIKEHDLVILAGKTGTGKTGFALNLLNDLSKTYPCLYINIELSEETIVQRLIAMNSGITMNELDNCYMLPQRKLDMIHEYADSIDNNQNIDVVTGSQSINNIKNLIGSFNQEKHFIVFIDHIGRISSYGKGLYEKMTNIVIELRNLCLDFNCTIIGLCQLSRESSKVDTPSLDLLRDSGEIEQSARKVLFVWEDKKTRDYSIYLLKNDSGTLGMIPIFYDKPTQKFRENGGNRDVRK
jgi:replicative DNA helicase